MKQADYKLLTTFIAHFKGMVKALEIWVKERMSEDAKPPQEGDKTVI